MSTVTVVDYGVGNLYSVCRALQAVGAEVRVSSDPNEIRGAERLVFPGVGAFKAGMLELQARGLVEALGDFAGSGRPMLAICLGMQLLFESSEEFGVHPGLGLLRGKVVSIPSLVDASVQVPHIGWSGLLKAGDSDWRGTILDDLGEGEAFYFVHSFAAVASVENRLADCAIGGIGVTAVVRSGAIFGCQFHPEKSGPAGLSILRRFMTI